jgi:hypothetical protein
VSRLLGDADFDDFHSALGFRLSPVRCVTDDLQGFSLRLFVHNGACFFLRIQNNKIFGRGPCFRSGCRSNNAYAGCNKDCLHIDFSRQLNPQERDKPMHDQF